MKDTAAILGEDWAAVAARNAGRMEKCQKSSRIHERKLARLTGTNHKSHRESNQCYEKCFINVRFLKNCGNHGECDGCFGERFIDVCSLNAESGKSGSTEYPADLTG